MRARDRRWLTGVLLRLVLLVGSLSLVLTCSHGPRERGQRPGYLRFSGNLSGVEVRVDGGKRTSIPSIRGETADKHPGDNRSFLRLTPGKHRINVFRDERLLVSKRMYLPPRVVADVRVP